MGSRDSMAARLAKSTALAPSLQHTKDLRPNLVDALVCIRKGDRASLAALVVLQDRDRLVVVLLEALLQRILVVIRALHQRFASLVILHVLCGRRANPVV